MKQQIAGCLTSFALLATLGCSDSSQPGGPAAGSATAAGQAGNSEAHNDALAHAAREFLSAVLQGDTQQATARLTPLAVERIRAGDKAFAPPGLETATFRIGEIRRANEAQALVQCILTDTNGGQTPQEEEMCCLMRLVDGRWLVSGIGYESGPNQQPIILDFESPQSGQSQSARSGQMATGRQPTGSPQQASQPDRYATPATAADAAAPRTAQDPFLSPPPR